MLVVLTVFFDTFQFWFKWGQVYGYMQTDLVCISAGIATHKILIWNMLGHKF